MPKSRTHVSANTTKVQCMGNNGISEREKFVNDIRQACELKIQVREPTFLVQRVLCGHGRKKCKEDRRVYTATVV